MNIEDAECPDCGGQFRELDKIRECQCQGCGLRLRTVVVERLDTFKRVAESDRPLSDIAQAALAGTA